MNLNINKFLVLYDWGVRSICYVVLNFCYQLRKSKLENGNLSSFTNQFHLSHTLRHSNPLFYNHINEMEYTHSMCMYPYDIFIRYTIWRYKTFPWRESTYKLNLYTSKWYRDSYIYMVGLGVVVSINIHVELKVEEHRWIFALYSKKRHTRARNFNLI